MPGHRVHLVGGVATFSLITAICHTSGFIIQNNVFIFALGLGLSLLGSIFPDIDITSVMQRLFYTTMVITLLALLCLGLTHLFFIASASCFAVALLKHRTITHSPVFLVVAPLVLIFAAGQWEHLIQGNLVPCYFFFVGGALSHVILDFYLPKRFH